MTPESRPLYPGWLRVTREGKGWSRRKVAEALDVTPEAVRDYELAETRGAISLHTLSRVAAVLGCDVSIALVPKAGGSDIPDGSAMPSQLDPGEDLAPHLK